MSEIRNSELLDTIMHQAEALCKENECSSLNRDYIIVAAIQVIGAADMEKMNQPEYGRTLNILSDLDRNGEKLNGVLKKWQHKEVSVTEKMILATLKGKLLQLARQEDREELSADLYLQEILKNVTPGIAILQKGKESGSGDGAPKASASPVLPAGIPKKKDPGNSDACKEKEEEAEPREAAGVKSILTEARELQSGLLQTVMGQQHAVSVFASGYFQAELQARIDRERRQPRATFLFAGPPGVGKTFLSEEAARLLKLPFQRYDMSEYTGPAAKDELSGSDENYKGSKEGLLTGFVKRNPHCLLLFDEIEKAGLDVIHLFLQILDAGRLRDNRTNEEVSFRDTILIFTTNAGKALYENGNAANLSSLSRDVILDALAHDVNPKTNEPFFPAAICSRFASGNVMMFNHLEAESLRMIVERELNKHIRNMEESLKIEIRMNEDVPTALLLAEGASADARTVKSRADSFFGGELYELFRLISSEKIRGNVDRIQRIDISVNLDGEPDNVVSLFMPAEKIHAISYGFKQPDLKENHVLIPVIHEAENAEQAEAFMEEENIQLVFCNLFGEENNRTDGYLNMEDRDTAGRRFLQAILEQHPQIKVVLTEPEGCSFSEEERVSYLRRGISGFLSLAPEGLEQRIAGFTGSIFRQNGMAELARNNRLLHFETAQSVEDDGELAEIVLFDLKLNKAIKAEDAGNVMSMLSTPDVHFSDVIGAEDAKDELKFFVSYMQQPGRFRKTGISSPKGVLLYGPPGTGKTMMAKAFAAESKATFIATEGNQFFKGVVGQGAAMMHQIFATARRYAPSVIFIDEIDTIARARSGRDTDMAQDSEQILTALFAEMDGFSTQSEKPVFVLGATNYSVEPGARMTLDAGMLRRFDRRILVDLPSKDNRELFIRRETGKKSIFKLTPEGIASLADRSTGMSLAQLSSVLDLAIRSAIRQEKEYVDDSVLDEAFETFNSGESRDSSPESTLRTARHEAGHAVIAWLSGEKPSYITVVGRGNYGGYMRYADQEKRMTYTRRELLDRIRTALGGRAAEIVCYGEEEGLSTGPSGDLKNATELARQMFCTYGMDKKFGLAAVEETEGAMSESVQQAVNLLLKEELDKAIRVITENRSRLDRLVEELLKSNSLKSGDIDNILGSV